MNGLLWALTEGKDLPVVMFLILNGANLNLMDKDGNTAMHHAAKMGEAHALKIFHSVGGSLIPKNYAGKSPLDLAMDAGQATCVTFIRLAMLAAEGGTSFKEDLAFFSKSATEEKKPEKKGK
eukprot:TRINITY_DN50367_c0_g1_i1.p1 TRINITY_DN50367_c0_g1~~TRINITY_DN50367_c0_g1_i1.p1  ORF type:complete len:129 (+),score=11.50 TRINITY_DN50367_c0_g1_i1:23-388(+)